MPSSLLIPPQDEPIIVSDKSEQKEEVAKDKDIHASSHDVPKDTSIPHPPSLKLAQIQELKAQARPLYPDINQLTDLLVTSLKPEFSKLLASHNFSSCLPTEMKEFPSKFNELSSDVKELTKHVRDMEIELHGDLKEIPTKPETFTSTISNLTSKVAELKNIQWELPAEFQALPVLVSSVQKKLKTLDSLPSILNKVAETLNRLATMVENASRATTKDVPLAGQATVSPAKGVSDLHFAEWREVVQACPDRKEKGWKTIYGLIKTRMEYLDQTKKELQIDFNKPLKEQDPLIELNELANKKRKRTSDLKDHSRSLKDWEVSSLQFMQRFQGTNITLFKLPLMKALIITLFKLLLIKSSDDTLKSSSEDTYDQRTIYKGRRGSSFRNATITKPEKPKSRSKHLAPTPRTGSACTTLGGVWVREALDVPLQQYTKDSGFELTRFSDADYVGCKDTFKSTFGGAQFLGEKLVLRRLGSIFTSVYAAVQKLKKDTSRRFLDEYKENLKIQTELDKKNMTEMAVYNELSKRCSRLENWFISLEIKLQQNKKSFQTNRPSHNQDAPEFKEFFIINPWNKGLEKLGVSSSTEASGSKPRITQTSSSNKKTNKVEDQPRIAKSSVNNLNRVSKIVCNANVKHSVLNTNSELICATCHECMFDAIHDLCVRDYLVDVNAHVKSQYVKSKNAKSKKERMWKPTGKVYTNVGYRWKPTRRIFTIGHTIHTLGTVRFGNNQIAKIMGYGDYEPRNVTILRVYYVEGLGHNLFSVGQFCDSKLEVAFRKHTYYVRNLDGADLISRSRDTNLYTISLDDMLKSFAICLLSKASKTKSWLWHRRLSL
ncbi:hypothetical protein Tco_0729148 [Tanacetum coccineum]|uniref:Integrase, catalytic region, zinc finger, CCHC-type, peptidase aspartic, catalytic n=1 Tax=Tanacetum coccineum TaxID=301880 RepID=A0ABQ4YQS2_9ASTR